MDSIPASNYHTLGQKKQTFPIWAQWHRSRTGKYANSGSGARSANSMYAPGTRRSSPSAKRNSTVSATVELCSRPPSGLTWGTTHVLELYALWVLSCEQAAALWCMLTLSSEPCWLSAKPRRLISSFSTRIPPLLLPESNSAAMQYHYASTRNASAACLCSRPQAGYGVLCVGAHLKPWSRCTDTVMWLSAKPLTSTHAAYSLSYMSRQIGKTNQVPSSGELA